MSTIRRKRLWSKGKEGVYLVNGTSHINESSPKDLRNRKRSRESDTRASISSTDAGSYSLETADDKKKPQQFSRGSSFDDSSLEVNGKDSVHGSLDSLGNEEDVWEMSADENAVRLLSSQRKGSLALNQILLGIDRKENSAENPENNQMESQEDDEGVNVKDIVAAISGRRNSAGSEMDSDSDSSTAVSETSDVSDVSSDEESEPDLDHGETFDLDNHINRLVKRENGSESESKSDSDSDGNESVTSDKVFQKAVRKVIKKIKRERSDEIADSDLESTQTSEKGSETEESPSSDDSEASDKEDDASDASSTKSERGSFEMERNIDPEIAELMEGELVIDPKKGKPDGNNSRTVYKYYMTENGRINSTLETVENEDFTEEDEDPADEADGFPMRSGRKQEDNLESTLDDSKAQDLRWPFSNFYVKEFSQDLEEPLPDKGDALPSYRSTAASAFHPGRKRNVMLGRVWWVEWWAKEDSRLKKIPDTSNAM